jgi:hypothetical protein
VQNEQKLDMGGVRKDGKTKKDALVFKNRSVLPLIISTYCFARNFAAKLRAKQFQQPHPRLKITPHLNFPKDRPSEKDLRRNLNFPKDRDLRRNSALSQPESHCLTFRAGIIFLNDITILNLIIYIVSLQHIA